MDNQQKLEAVRAKIIEAVPAIMDLKFGCEVILKNVKGWHSQIIIGKDNWEEGWRGDTIDFGENEIKKIIGRPIRLSDVLCAIEGINLLYTIRADGLFMKRKGEIVHKMEYDFVYSDNGNIVWNLLNDDLNNQKPETISFLFNILCK